MSFHADIKLGVKINEVDYDINVSIPNAAPTNDNPYTFSVIANTQNSANEAANDDNADTQQTSTASPENLLTMVIGDKDHYFVSIEPPKAVLEQTNGIVGDLAVSVNEGDYDVKTGKFGDKADNSEAAASDNGAAASQEPAQEPAQETSPQPAQEASHPTAATNTTTDQGGSADNSSVSNDAPS